MKYFYICIALLLSTPIYTQEISGFETIGIDSYYFSDLDLSDCSYDIRCTGIPGTGSYNYIAGCVYSPTGKIYVVNGKDNELYQYDETNCTFIYVDTLLGLATSINDPFYRSSITVDQAGMLYIGGQQLIKYNPFDGTQSIIFEFDNSIPSVPYLFMYGDSLLGLEYNRNYVFIDTIQDKVDTIFTQIQIAETSNRVATQYITHCDSVSKLVMGSDLFDWATFSTRQILLDVSPSFKVDTLCIFPDNAAYFNAFFCSKVSTRNACEVVIRLDSDSSSMAMNNGYLYRVDCPDDSISVPICDTDLVSDINILPHLDSVVVRLSSGIVDIGQEYLAITGSISPNISIIGAGSSEVRLRRLPQGTMNELESALKQVRYTNSNPKPSAGERRIDVVPYRYHLSGKVTTARIVVAERQKSDTSITVTLCAGATLTVASNVYTVSGVYKEKLTNFIGCDSTITYFLTILPTNIHDTTALLCPGSVLLIGNSLYDKAGFYSDTLLAYNGCDSIIRTDLKYFPANFKQESKTICFGEQWTVGTKIYLTSGIYLDTLISSSNCDSIIETQLTVLPFLASTTALSVCDGDSIYWHNAYYSIEGVYTDTLITNLGCDSICTLVLSNTQPLSQQIDTILCVGKYIDVQGQRIDKAGEFLFFVNNNSSGCRDTLFYKVAFDDLLLTPISDINILRGDSTSVTLEIQSGAPIESITWMPSDGIDCDTCISIILSPPNSTLYQIKVTNDLGCTSTETFNVIVTQRGRIYIPNVISLSEENAVNRLFNIFSDDSNLSLDCKIVDRWGGLIFQEGNIKPNTWAGWDGHWKGKKLNPGVYMYSIRITKPEISYVETINGTITVVE
jgi:hypothetical protein